MFDWCDDITGQDDITGGGGTQSVLSALDWLGLGSGDPTIM